MFALRAQLGSGQAFRCLRRPCREPAHLFQKVQIGYFLPTPSTRFYVYARRKSDRKLPLIPSLKEFIVGIETDKSFLRYLIPVIVLGVC